MLVSEMDLVEFFLKHEKIALYGLGGMGTSLYSFMEMNGWDGKLAFFVVTHKEEDSFSGIPVKEVGSLTDDEVATPILLAIRRQHHESIRRELAQVGAGDVQIVAEDLLTRVEEMMHLREQEGRAGEQALLAAQMRQMQEGMSLLYQKMSRIQEVLGEFKDEKDR